ncbi:MAG TPA: hypothetical protein VIE42_15160 [Steroidobacteraceae bacterium]|jgi:hypothetical protein
MVVSKRTLASLLAVGILAVALASVGRAQAAPGAAPGCAAATQEQAKLLAGQFYRQGQYQRAGECYQAAGDLADANEAFVKAIPANSDAARRELHRQGQVAKTLFTNLQQHFRSSH